MINKTRLQEETDNECRYWWINANPKTCIFSKISIGQKVSITLLNENNRKRRFHKNFLNAKKGDMVIGYQTSPYKKIVAICTISAEQDGEKILIEKVEDLLSPIDISTLESISELKEMQFFKYDREGTLFCLTKNEYDSILKLIREKNKSPEERNYKQTIESQIKKDDNKFDYKINDKTNDNDILSEPKQTTKKYGKEDFLAEVFMSESRYDRLVAVLKNKKNIILQGAPGVGKTFAARRLAYSIMGESDESRIEFVQFHQNYSYEDFMMGYKPTDNGFKLEYGIFYNFCKTAEKNPNVEYFFIIDEINRGNMSKVFGELLMLIENDYRGRETTLAYGGNKFSVPTNLYIIGMMNTADRSLATIDHAMRRRFSFFEISQAFDSEGFNRYKETLESEIFNRLIDKVKELNDDIANDNSLGKGFCIGHSYFCNWRKEDCTKERMKQDVDFDLIPMLEEYWFDDNEKVQKWSNELSSIIE